MVLICLTLGLLASALSLGLTRLMIPLGRAVGQVDAGARTQVGAGTPLTGGVAVFVAVAGPMAVGLAAVWMIEPSHWQGWLAPLRDHVDGLRLRSGMAVILLMSLLVVHAMGVVDDRMHLSPLPKLAVQLAVAVTLAAGFEVRVFEFLEAWGAAGTALSVVLSVLWIATIVNAMNFLDNMNGLCAGVGAIVAGIYLAATLLGGQWFVAAVCALLVGALLGFLPWNYPRGRIFLGDGGSLVVGLLLAVISIRTTYVIEAPGADAAVRWHGVLMPMIALAVPLYDLLSVTLIRLRSGRSPFVGDHRHFSHRLVQRGFSKPVAVLIIWLCTLATGLGAVMFNRLSPWQACLVAGQVVAVLGLLALLESAPLGMDGSRQMK